MTLHLTVWYMHEAAPVVLAVSSISLPPLERLFGLAELEDPPSSGALLQPLASLLRIVYTDDYHKSTDGRSIATNPHLVDSCNLIRVPPLTDHYLPESDGIFQSLSFHS
jgi:hypothetical protein